MPSITNRSRSALAAAWLAGACGLLYFCFLAGPAVLDVRHIEWLLRHDWSQHYVGWAFYRATRASAWALPLGRLPEVVEPDGTTLSLLDGNPLLSLLLGTISSALPTRFQFIGPYLAANFALQGYFGARLIARLGAAASVQWLGGCLFVAMPVLLHRVPHDTLTPHWLLLWVMATYFPAHQLVGTRRTDALRLVAACFLAAATHAYLLAMVLPLVWGSAVSRLRRAAWREGCLMVCGALSGTGVAMTVMWMLGLWGETRNKSLGFGFFSANVWSLLDPSTWSRLLPSLGTIPFGQRFEGFGYVGIGALVLMAAAAFGQKGLLGRDSDAGEATVSKSAPRLAPSRKDLAHNGAAELLLVCALMYLYALSDHIYAGRLQVLDLTHLYDALGPMARLFRSSGRFVWPLGYALLGAALYRLARRASLWRQRALMLAALVMQLAEVDVAGVHAQFASPVVQPLASPLWQQAWPDYKHVALLPPWFPGSDLNCGYAYRDKYEVPLLLFAAEHGMGVNSAYLSHYDRAQVLRACQREKRIFLDGRLRADTLYVLPPELVAQNDMAAHRMRCALADGYTLCIKQGDRPSALWRRLGEASAPALTSHPHLP